MEPGVRMTLMPGTVVEVRIHKVGMHRAGLGVQGGHACGSSHWRSGFDGRINLLWFVIGEVRSQRAGMHRGGLGSHVWGGSWYAVISQTGVVWLRCHVARW